MLFQIAFLAGCLGLGCLMAALLAHRQARAGSPQMAALRRFWLLVAQLALYSAAILALIGLLRR